MEQLTEYGELSDREVTKNRLTKLIQTTELAKVYADRVGESVGLCQFGTCESCGKTRTAIIEAIGAYGAALLDSVTIATITEENRKA